MTENASTGNFNRAQRRALAVWMTSRTVDDIAEAAGVSASTVYRWKQSPAFASALSQLQAAALADATSQLVREQSASITTLATLRDDTDAPPQVRRGASRDLLELSQRFIELTEIESRLSDLERLHHDSQI